MIVMIDPINENETILFDLFKWCQHSQVRDPSVDSFEINRLSGLGVWLLRYLVHCFSDIRLVSSDIMADFADGADGVPAIKKQRAAKAKDGVDIYKQDASVSDVFGDLKGRILLEAIWNTYQARAKAYIYIYTDRKIHDSMFAAGPFRWAGITELWLNLISKYLYFKKA